MHHTSIKIAELINYLDNNILDELKIWLQYDASIKNELQLLFDSIYKNKLNNIISNTENLHKSVYKKQQRTPNEFRKLCHELLQKVESYLAIVSLKNDTAYQQYLLLKFYSNHQLFSFYESTKHKIEKTESVLFSSSIVQATNLYKESHYVTLIEDKTRASENYILPYSEALDVYYILQKLKLICHALNEQHFTTYTSLPAYTNEILQIDTKQYNILIQFYYAVAKLLQDITNEDAYYTLKKSIQKNATIAQEDLKTIIQYLINFSVIKINKGNSNFIQELFEWYKHHDVVIEETQISAVRFRNIINIAIRLKEYNYAFHYIEKNGIKLPKELQESTIDFNKAKLFYAQKKYDDVIDILKTKQYNDIIFNLSAKVLMVQSFYEKKEFQFLESFLESFRIFVLRNKEMNTASKKIHQDFIKVIHRLMKMEYANKKEIETFKNKIEANVSLPDKAWILEKLDAY